MNWLIIITNSIIFSIMLSLSEDELRAFYNIFGLVPSRVTAPNWNDFHDIEVNQYFPFFTNMFLHGGWFHFITNMWTLIIFGRNVEARMGSFPYLLFYLICGLGASFTHFFLYMTSGIPALGASGAISGIMAAYMFLFPFSKITFLLPVFFIPLFFSISALFYIAFWFIVQLMSGMFDLMYGESSSGIAFWAHIGGFMAGILFFGFFLNKKRRLN